MEFSDESYVRLYVRDTKTWLRLGFEGQCVLMFTLRKLDRAGVLDDMGETAEDLALVTGVPLAIVTVGLARLLERGVFVMVGSSITMPNYLKAQHCRKSDKLRQQESRIRRSLGAVTECDEMSPAVTGGHQPSQHVTPSLAQPSLAQHITTSGQTTSEDEAKTLRLAKGCPSSSSDALSLGSTFSAGNPTPDQPRSAFPENTQPTGIPTVIREIPDGMTLPEEVRQDARIIGLSDQQIDHYWGELCKGPIGGTRGILQKRFAKYLRDLPKQWKVWADTEKARSSNTIKPGGAFKPRYGSGSVWEPKSSHELFCSQYGITPARMAEMAKAYNESGEPEQRGGKKDADDAFLKRLQAEVTKKRKAAG